MYNSIAVYTAPDSATTPAELSASDLKLNWVFINHHVAVVGKGTAQD